MRDEILPDGEPDDPSPLDRRLQAIDAVPIPDDLMGRCLATIPDSDQHPLSRRRRLSGWKARVAAVAAAVLLIGAIGLIARPRHADAAQLLKTVEWAWTKVPTSHSVVLIHRAGGTRREETWFVRDKGRRQEVRREHELIAVFVRNSRWDFRWDVRGRIVAAWSTVLATEHRGTEADGLVQDREALLRWAETNRAEIHVEPDTIDGRRARKILLRWPGPPDGGVMPRAETIWFDPDSLRPVKRLVEFDDGQSIETRIDYPAPEAIAEDLFAFRPPPDAVIEINDPDLGRQVYSEAQRRPVDTAPRIQKGGER
jgi:hypothetical protein